MLLDYKKVSVYQANVPVLKDVDIQVDEGEFIYITGKVGTGKSSLLKTMYCEIDICDDDAEKAEVLGRDLKRIRRKEIPALRREMGVIFQDFQLLHDRTVENNLKLVLKATGWKDKKAISERIDEVLEAVEMPDCRKKMPSQLSGGEQQRIAIARAMLNNPKLIVADEPTAHLDSVTAANIVALLKQVAEKGTAVVISTHNNDILDKFPGKVYECAENELRIKN